MGYAGESARAAVEDESNESSKTLLSNYDIATPNPSRTPRMSTGSTPFRTATATPFKSENFGSTPSRSVHGGTLFYYFLSFFLSFFLLH